MKVNGVILKSLLAGAVTLACSHAFAGTITIGSATAPVGGGATTPAAIPVTFTGGGAGDTTVSVECRIYTPAGVTFSSVTTDSPADTLCGHNPVDDYVLVSVASPTNTLPTDGAKCSITYTVDAGAVAGDVFTLSSDMDGLPGGECTFGDVVPAAIPGTLVDGAITVSAGPPPDVIVTFTPASGGTVTFPGGMPADVVTQSIAIGNTGTIGSGTVSGCVLGGADAGAFAITGGNPSTVPPATSLDLSATLGAAALNATLTCDVTDSGGTSTATWTLTAPAGTVLAAPTLSSNPASGTAITLPGSYGTPVSSNIVITPAGGDAGGPNASVTCSTASAGFTVTPAGALTFTPPGGAAQNAVVGCTPGAAAINGTVTCTGTDQAGAIAWTYPVTCPAASTAPPPPTFVPATSLWSKLALFGVFAALGMLILGLRRNH